MEALLAAWNCANTEHGNYGAKKPVPNADGWSINWKERDVNGRAASSSTTKAAATGAFANATTTGRTTSRADAA